MTWVNWTLVIALIAILVFLAALIDEILIARRCIRELSKSEADLRLKLSQERGLRSGFERAYNEERSRLQGVMMRLEHAETMLKKMMRLEHAETMLKKGDQ